MKPVFDAYSSYYDLLYQDKDYAAEAAYVLSAIRAHKPDAEQVLELPLGQRGEVFLLNADPRSLDSRYFGPLPASAVVGRAQAVWTPQRASHGR